MTIPQQCSARGLSSSEAAARLASDGRNVLPRPPGPSLWRQLLSQLTHLLALLLWVAAGLALLAGMPELAVAIVVIVLLNGGFAFWQEFRADRSSEELRALLPAGSRVIRDGTEQVVEVADLVVGDWVLLQAGDRVAADVVVRSSRALTLDESMLTGESDAVPHGDGDRLLAGTFVLQGNADAEVVATGTHTTLADITFLTASAHRPPSPLTRQLNHVVRIVAIVAIATGSALGVTAVLLGLPAAEAFLFGVGVTVALVPEGLLPTVTLSLARGAQVMAGRRALVRRLDAVETLGATTFICTDKTGTLTQNRMNVVAVVTPQGSATVTGEGYRPVAEIDAPDALRPGLVAAARAAASCVTGRAVQRDEGWVADGDPMEAALHALALRVGAGAAGGTADRIPYSPDRMLSSCLDGNEVSVLGAPEAVMARCREVPPSVESGLAEHTAAGRRVVAVARRHWAGPADPAMESDLELLGLLALEDPPREGVAEALRACRQAEIRVAMLTGDHPRTAAAIAREVGLLDASGTVLEGSTLPEDDDRLAELLDQPGGAVVARVSPAQKLRIARALRSRGHVVAMTGDGVNDAPALREADVGVAMGASGSDVAREAADLVLLDDHFATIVGAVELGRATFQNIRRFLTYHLTDNVAELAPFALWALSGGQLPLAITVLQVLALDIGTDMLPAIALGSEPPRRRVMAGRPVRAVIDRSLLARAFGLLGALEATASMLTFVAVLQAGGWTWGSTPGAGTLAAASGSAFAVIAVCQMANAFACRSTARPVWRLRLFDNRLLLVAVATEAVLLIAFLGIPVIRDLLGGGWPPLLGWAGALGGALLLLLADGADKARRSRRLPTERP